MQDTALAGWFLGGSWNGPARLKRRGSGRRRIERRRPRALAGSLQGGYAPLDPRRFAHRERRDAPRFARRRRALPDFPDVGVFVLYGPLKVFLVYAELRCVTDYPR